MAPFSLLCHMRGSIAEGDSEGGRGRRVVSAALSRGPSLLVEICPRKAHLVII